jgi:hypothetical protein
VKSRDEYLYSPIIMLDYYALSFFLCHRNEQ